MPLSLAEQAKQLIDKSEKILLVAHTKMDGDTLSSAISMNLLLRKLQKDTVVACADSVPEEFSFLPKTDVMKREISAGKDFVISLDCSHTHAQKLRWKIENGHLKIFVTPENGTFKKEDVSFFEHTSFDLIISLDAADRKQLGNIFEDNKELFMNTPVIVFDHHSSNPGFGTVNIIDIQAASTTEVIYHFLPILFGKDWEKYIDPDISTLLLTGIITDTGSFQNPNTTPRSLEVAADLVELGARQQEIIRNIFKTKNIQTLKLWGRVLSKINTDPIHRMLWSTVSANDLVDTGGLMEDTGGIIDELLATAPGMEMVLLLKERKDGTITVSIRTTTPLCDAAKFSEEFGGGGHIQAAGFKIRGNKPFDVVVGEVISTAQEFQSQRLKFPEKQQLKKLPIQIQKESSPNREKNKQFPVSIEMNPLEKPISVEILKEPRKQQPPDIQEEKAPQPPQEATKKPSPTSPKEINQKIQKDNTEEIITPPSEAQNGIFRPKKEIPFREEDFSEMLEKIIRAEPEKKIQDIPPKDTGPSHHAP
jgi:phosphoesterase RecJ-like protein